LNIARNCGIVLWFEICAYDLLDSAIDDRCRRQNAHSAKLRLHCHSRVGLQMARERGLIYTPSQADEYVSGRLAGIASLVSGRFAMIENGLGFHLVPWQPVLEKRIGQHITGLQRDDGGIEWTLGRNRGLSL
jgi:hypothetical protein